MRQRCSVLQSVEACCSVLQRVEVRCGASSRSRVVRVGVNSIFRIHNARITQVCCVGFMFIELRSQIMEAYVQTNHVT